MWALVLIIISIVNGDATTSTSTVPGFSSKALCIEAARVIGEPFSNIWMSRNAVKASCVRMTK